MAEALLGIRCLNRQSSTARSSSAESMICNRSGRKRSAIFGASSSEGIDQDLVNYPFYVKYVKSCKLDVNYIRAKTVMYWLGSK